MSAGESEWERQKQHRETEKELQAHFAGRRGALRTDKTLTCNVVGPHGKFSASLVDVSRSGALVAIVDPRFASGEDFDQLMLYTARVWHHFPEGLELRVSDRDVCAVANIVRVRVQSGSNSRAYELGLQFRTELTPEECDRLGVAHSDDRNVEEERDNKLADALDRLLTTMTPTDS